MTSAPCVTTSLSFAPAGQPARAASVRKAQTTCWQLEAGRAMTFKAFTSGAVGVSSGQLWLTFSNTGRLDAAGQVDTTRAHPLRLTGDFLLRPGDRFELAAGETVVFESFGPAPVVGIDWRAKAAPEATIAPADLGARRASGVSGALRELRVAVGHTLGAAMRLTLGLTGSVLALGGLRDDADGRTFDAVSSDPSVQCRLY